MPNRATESMLGNRGDAGQQRRCWATEAMLSNTARHGSTVRNIKNRFVSRRVALVGGPFQNRRVSPIVAYVARCCLCVSASPWWAGPINIASRRLASLWWAGSLNHAIVVLCCRSEQYTRTFLSSGVKLWKQLTIVILLVCLTTVFVLPWESRRDL